MEGDATGHRFVQDTTWGILTMTAAGFMEQRAFRRLRCYETKQFFPQGTFNDVQIVVDSIQPETSYRPPNHFRCLQLKRIIDEYLEKRLMVAFDYQVGIDASALHHGLAKNLINHKQKEESAKL